MSEGQAAQPLPSGERIIVTIGVMMAVLLQVLDTTISVSEVAIAHSTDAAVNPTTEISSRRLRPTLSASQPLIGRAIAEATM